MLFHRTLFKIGKPFSILLIVASTLLILSFNPNTNKQKAELNVAFLDVTVPSFRIEKTELQKLYDPPKNMRKLILKWGVNNFANPSDVILLVYGAKDQVTHGLDEVPLRNVKLEGTSSITSPIIIGNNYIDLETLLYELSGTEKDFTYMLLKAKNGTGKNKNHLLFEFNLIREVKKDNKIVDKETIFSGESQPSPPANAGQ